MHLPLLRAGQPYASLDRLAVAHIATGQPLAQVSQANRGLIARDLAAQERNRQALQAFTVAELVAICQRAADLFLRAELPLGDDGQTPDDYVAQVSATTGLPQSLARANMDKIHRAGVEMPAVLNGLTRGLDLTWLRPVAVARALGTGVLSGLTRGLDLTILDDGPSPLHFVPHAQALGCILPSNSPGVHALWLPAIPLKTPLVLKPGREEPWTPYRIAQALIAAGCPPHALSYYPTDHGGSTEILLRCERSLLFGGGATVAPWRGDPRVQLHGPGRSKIIIGADKIDHWEHYLDLMVASIAANGGRSCLNASGIWVPAHGREIATALGERLSQIQASSPRRPPSPNRRLPQSRRSAPTLSPNRRPTRRRGPRHGQRPRRAHRRGRWLHLPQPDLDPRPRLATSAGQYRIYLPFCRSRRSPAGRSGRAHRPDAGSHRPH